MSEAANTDSTSAPGERPALDIPRKTCTSCDKEKPLVFFSRDRNSSDGRQRKCKECQKNYCVGRVPKGGRRASVAVKSTFEAQPETVRAIIECMMENPRMPFAEMAQRVGVSASRCQKIVYSNSYIGALRQVAGRKLSNLIPKAVRSLDESLESANADVKFKSAVKLLENEQVLGPNRVDVTLNDLRNQPVDKLQEIIKQGAAVPNQVIIDAEVVS